MFFFQVNGKDVSTASHEEAVDVFLAAEEPIIVEVKRRGPNYPTDSLEMSHNIKDNFSSHSFALQNLPQHNSLGANVFPEQHSEITLHNQDVVTHNRQGSDHANYNEETTTSSNFVESDEIAQNSVLRNINESIMIPKEFNDCSESTSTLTINPDAAVSEEFLSPTINYDVSNIMWYICISYNDIAANKIYMKT